MTFNSDLKSHTPEELPADNAAARLRVTKNLEVVRRVKQP